MKMVVGEHYKDKNVAQMLDTFVFLSTFHNFCLFTMFQYNDNMIHQQGIQRNISEMTLSLCATSFQFKVAIYLLLLILFVIMK